MNSLNRKSSFRAAAASQLDWMIALAVYSRQASTLVILNWHTAYSGLAEDELAMPRRLLECHVILTTQPIPELPAEASTTAAALVPRAFRTCPEASLEHLSLWFPTSACSTPFI